MSADPYRPDSGNQIPNQDPTRIPRRIRSGTLWAGGLATAVVSALVAAVGVVVCDAVFNLHPVHLGLPGDSDVPSWISYPVIAFVGSLAATALLHLLLVRVPQPVRFFNWIMGLIAVLAAALPFTQGFSGRALVTAIIGVVCVVAITLLLIGTASRALVPIPPARQATRPPYPPS